MFTFFRERTEEASADILVAAKACMAAGIRCIIIYNVPEEKFYQFDSDPEGVLWLHQFSDKLPIAYCAKHQVPLETESYVSNDAVFCPVDRQNFQFPNDWIEQQRRVTLALINRDRVKDLPIIRVDSEGADVVAKERLKLVEEYWIAGKVSDTSKGIQIMVRLVVVMQAMKRCKSSLILGVNVLALI